MRGTSIMASNGRQLKTMNRILKKWKKVPLVIKVSVSYAICNVLQKCLSFITLPLFTRLLTTDQYGQYTVYQSWLGIISIFLTLNLAYGSFSTAMVKYEKDRDGYIASLEGICLVLSTIFLIIYLPFQNYWNRLFQLPSWIILIMVVEIIFSTAFQLWSGKKRFEFKYKSVIGSTFLTAILSPLLAYLLIQVMQQNGYARILDYSCITIAIGGFLFILNLIRGKRFYSSEYWKFALGFNIPLIAYYLSQTIFNQSDRIMISHLCGESEAAMYGVAYNLAMVLTFVLNAINNSYIPWFYGKIKEGRPEDNQTISCGIALILSLMLLCVIWFAPEIIKLMAGENYTPAIPVVAPISMSLLLLFYAQLFINVEFYYEEKKLLVCASIGAAVLNIGLNAILIPIFSFVAAGYTTLASYIVFVICNYFAMRQTMKKRQQKTEMYRLSYLVAILVVFIISSFLGVALYDYFFVRIMIALIILIILICLRNILLGIMKEIKK